MRFLILFLFILCMKNACAADALKSYHAPVCGDFLKQLGLQRADVRFINCKQVTESELTPGGGRVAEYHVKGKDVGNVENWLVHIAPDIKRLRFNCCGWETTDGTIKGPHGGIYSHGAFYSFYSIEMNSGETTFSGRKDIPKIPFMYLTVTYYLGL